MKILVVGAGGTGGYFGGRLLQAGRDVTFLVRPRRAALLAEHGLTIRSRFGDFHRPAPPTVIQANLDEPFDLILLSCKAYDLDSAIASFAPAVGPRTAILPLLNGMRHLESLAERFGAERVFGGLCIISATLGEDGTILHLNDLHGLTFGELDGTRSARIEAVAAALLDAGFAGRLSETIRQEMWEKWLFIAAAAGATCLMRAAVGDIVAAGAADLATGLIDECAAIATAQGFPPRPASLAMARVALTQPGSMLTASMLRDVENGMPVEADHILGDLLRRTGAADNRALLRVAYAHLKAYEARRAREATSQGA
ncbi:MAG: 2-dehydropantoate 2-reductase [Hyphomicrobiales bacterium]|nr:2-dehydropantoate 2-reductase [Hyphomicrobiales bacterium]